MKRSFVAACLMLFLAAVCFAQQARPQRPAQQLRPRDVAPRGAQNQPILDMIEGFYVSQLPTMMELSDEQLVKMLPALRQSLRDRFEISGRRTRVMAQLRQNIDRSGSDEDMTRLVREMDRADADVQANRQNFLATVDPMLTPRQQARLRMALTTIEQRVGNMIQRATNANANRQPPRTAESPDF